jgi:FkbM family methyltransferase
MIERAISSTTVGFARTRFGRYLYEPVIRVAMDQAQAISWRGQRMVFATPNNLSRYRVDTFATKEPSTLEWIDALPENAILWDVGANVGTYSIYAAKARGCRVYAFEPSVFNLELLARNIYHNQLQEQIRIVPIALGDALGVASFRMTTTEWGGALSGFRHNVDHNGTAITAVFEYQTIGVSMNEAVTLLQLPQPDFLKIDVDGIEHFILRGGREVLSKVKGVLIEINDDFINQSEEAARHLKDAGLTLDRKCDFTPPNLYNQLWRR